jgi:pimeloyl-ACP methyl ester carboxylesterase
MSATTHIRLRRGLLVTVAVAAPGLAAVDVDAGSALAATPAATAAAVSPLHDAALASPTDVRAWEISYRSHTGAVRSATVLLPRWYSPRRNPPLPLVISPHGRGGSGAANARLWGNLPAIGRFAVVNPDGQGARLQRFSWGAPGQIDDLARMPALVRRALPWLKIDRSRVYAFGGSMGGQETLLLVARHPHLLAGAAAFDSLVDFGHQYRQFPRLGCTDGCRGWSGSLGTALQRLARGEVGADPSAAPQAFARRSPIRFAREIARSGVPLQLWWSRTDRIVVDYRLQSRRLFELLQASDPAAPVFALEGTWAHTYEMRATSLMPYALARFGLMPPTYGRRPTGPTLRSFPPPATARRAAGTHAVSRACVCGEEAVWGRTDGGRMATSSHITRTGLGRIAAALAALALALTAAPIASNAANADTRTANAECCGP